MEGQRVEWVRLEAPIDGSARSPCVRVGTVRGTSDYPTGTKENVLDRETEPEHRGEVVEF